MSIHEEAEDQIILHVHDIIESGGSSVVVKTGKSDAVVIPLGFMEYFFLKQPEINVYVGLKTSGSEIIIKVNKCYSSLNVFFECLEECLQRSFIFALLYCPSMYNVYVEAGGTEVLKFFTCLQILLFWNNKSIVHFSK